MLEKAESIKRSPTQNLSSYVWPYVYENGHIKELGCTLGLKNEMSLTGNGSVHRDRRTAYSVGSVRVIAY